MTYTTDRNDPDLGHGVDDKPVSQNKKYLVLSDEEIEKVLLDHFDGHIFIPVMPAPNIHLLISQQKKLNSLVNMNM